ncbi:phage tail protein [Microbacterium sp. B2969]|uniref:Phage tail protein n=1 Tax=Microbacterium alkaliflavum TaxID=3248839 RepID=A0ABW7Q8Q7_9MICO
MNDDFLLPAFTFRVSLTRAPGRAQPPGEGVWDPAVLGTVGGFAECSGLELEADIKEYLEGGRNDGVVRRVGRVKLSPIVLKRGMFSAGAGSPANTDLWMWLTRMVSGVLPVTRYNGRIQILAPKARTPLATWTFERGLPQKVSGPSLNAKTGEIAIEELHIVHEGLRMELPR